MGAHSRLHSVRRNKVQSVFFLALVMYFYKYIHLSELNQSVTIRKTNVALIFFFFEKQTKSRNETGSYLSLGTVRV